MPSENARDAARFRFVLTTNIPTPYRVAFFQVLAGTFAERGVDFEVFYYARTEPNRRWTVDLADQRYPWTILPGFHPAFPGIYPHLNPSLPFLLRRRRPTWILVAGAWNTPSSLLAASRLLSGPGHRLFWSEGHSQAVLHPTGPVAVARRSCLRLFDGFAVPNDGSEKFIQDELKSHVHCLRLPNTVDEDFFLAGPGIERDDLRNRLGVATDDIVVLCVAELSDRKGVLELARAAALLADGPRARSLFVFAGDGPLRSEVEATGHRNRFRFLGQIGQKAIREWMYAADLFVLPSKIDPNPLSAIEAALCGMPLIMSGRAGNAVDLVAGGTCGWILPSLDPASISHVLDLAISFPAQERRAFGARGRQVARARFSRRDVAIHFADELLRVFPPKGSHPD